MSDFYKVGRFHNKFGLPRAEDLDAPCELNAETRDFRLRFLLEELTEICAGYGLELNWDLAPAIIKCPHCSGMGCLECCNGSVAVEPDEVQDLPKIADGLVDLVYVALGTAHLHGLPWDQLFDEVQRANMDKQRASADGSDSARGSALDVVKPPGWRAPDITGVLISCGWEGPEIK